MPSPPAVATIVVIFAIVEGRLQVLLVTGTPRPRPGGGRCRAASGTGGARSRRRPPRSSSRRPGRATSTLEQLFTSSGLDPTQPGVAIAYFALVDAGAVRLRQSADDAWRPAWHPVDALPSLAFANNRVIEQAVERVRAKLEYTNIAYGLLPERFTLRELQGTYEAILDGELDRRNFRKRMLSNELIEPTEELRREGAHRPARLYRFTRREPVFL